LQILYKERLVELDEKEGQKLRSFDFLGFTYYWSKSRKGKRVLKCKTSSKKFQMSLKRMDEWLKVNRHRKEGEIIRGVNQRLRGHYEYYGITFNSKKTHVYYEQTKLRLHYWLNCHGIKRRWNWEKYVKLIEEWNPLLRPRIYYSFL
jgi:RNA-directed DNA polymerase